MRHLIIKNLGPIASADLELQKVNVIVGPQSSGKSCVLKTACYCKWVEKRIELAQSAEYFEKDDQFITGLVNYHKLHGYVKADTFLAYESDLMRFSYDMAVGKFAFAWKEDRWNYSRSRVTYIPAERNMVSVIPNWIDVKLAEDNIRDFMSDWEVARKATVKEVEVLNLGVKYHYKPSSREDKVVVEDGLELDLTDTSSGLQSLIPLFVHLNYLDKLQYNQVEKESLSRVNEKVSLANIIYAKLYKDNPELQTYFAKAVELLINGVKLDSIINRTVGPRMFPFPNEESAHEFDRIYKRYANNNHCDIFLEEPELNLFPPTQAVLINWLMDIVDGEHPGTLFISTHSPYVVTSFLEKQRDDIGLYITNNPKQGGITVKVVSEAEKQEIYDCGVDVFFNHESVV